jgi:hypothetical protein
MFNRKSVLAACGAILGLAVAVSAGQWVNPSTMNYVTFSGPVGLPGVTLPAGTYLFELASPLTSPDLVRVRNEERTMVYLTTFTERIARPEGLPENHLISFGERSRGAVPPVAAWYPIGDSRGHKFIYRNAR